ncbi:MAG: hypothetical protein FJ303_16895 [Planctomycetes bacterium]|nr:hypothetical protein [Planctomycetota bacterium]
MNLGDMVQFSLVWPPRSLRTLKEEPRYAFAFESERRGKEPGPVWFTTDRKLIDALFEKANKAGRP